LLATLDLPASNLLGCCYKNPAKLDHSFNRAKHSRPHPSSDTSFDIMRLPPILFTLLAALLLSVPACHKVEVEQHEEQRKIVITHPTVRDVTLTEQYVCQIHSRRHIDICALEGSYLQSIPIKEGQSVKQGDLLFKILPTLYQAKLDSESAEAQLAQIEFENTKKLFDNRVVSDREVALAKAKLAKAAAQVQLSRTELNFTDIVAPFDGIVDRLHEQQGSLIEEGGVLTSLSDNSVMWVYFNVPEARYLEYKAEMAKQKDSPDNSKVELVLANGEKFGQTGNIGAIEADFNNETGNIAFRADFPNPDGLLRHGQTGNVLIHRALHGALVIPQRATFEILDKHYVFLVGEDQVVHQHEIEVENELEDIFLIKEGDTPDAIKATDNIVLEGVREVRDGETIKGEFRPPEVALNNLKNAAE
jgi:membrane fusion protein (multidrug efflux system)